MKSTKGLYLDTVNEDTPQGYMTFAKNVLLTEKLGIIQNEKGFLYHAQVPYTIIGVLPVLNTTVFWSVDGAGFSEIGTLQDDPITGTPTYKKIINDVDIASAPFKFNLNNPIDAEFHINAHGDIVVAWIDELNTPKVVNLNSVTRDLEAVPPVPIQPNDLELFPAAKLRTLRAVVEQFGGAVKSGSYQFTYFYEDDDGSTSNFAALSKPVGISRDPNSNSPNQVWGIEGGVPTSKAVELTLKGDTNWSFVNFVVVKTINNVTTAHKFKRVPLKLHKPELGGLGGFLESEDLLAEMTVLYTGNEVEETVSLNEILTPHAVYTNAKAITQLNNRLHLGNLTVAEEIIVQQSACNAKIKWRSTLVDVELARNREGSGWFNETFAHGEAYAFYLQVRDAITGVWSKGFHIPGHKTMGMNEMLVVAPSPSSGFSRSGNNSPTFKLYQLDDTIPGTPVPWSSSPFIGGSTDGFLGEMGYWENENEFYPDDPNFNGKLVDSSTLGVNLTPAGNVAPGNTTPVGSAQRVRHHKFPTLAYMRQVYTGEALYGKRKLDRLTIDVSNVFFPAEVQGKISAWRICYAKRSISNSTVLGVSGIYFFGKGVQGAGPNGTGVLKPVPANGTVLESVGDFINAIAISQDPYHTVSPPNPGSLHNGSDGAQYIRFHAFNLMVDKPSITPTYLRQEWKLSVTGGSSKTDAADDDDPRLVVGVDAADTHKWVLYDSRKSSSIISLEAIYRFRHVEFIQYLPTDAIIAPDNITINNRCGEDCVLLRNNVAGLTNKDRTLNMVSLHPFDNVIMGYAPVATQQHYVSSLCQLKSDLYVDFQSQDLVATDLVKEILSDPVTTPAGKIYIGGGDNWLGFHSVHLQGPVHNAMESGNPGEELQGVGSKGVHFFPVDCPKNLNYRYSDIADKQSYFYDKHSLRPKIEFPATNYMNLYVGLMNVQITPVYLYNADYNNLNDVGTNMIGFDPTIDTETEFPTTIARSIANAPESNVLNWKTFLVSDRYTMPRNKGVLENLQGIGNQRLLIHHTDTLYITKDRTTLEATIAQVTLGSGDIFDVTPFEVLSTDQGYAGTQHKFACVVTKIGYVFPDMSQGKIFIHDGEALQEISKNGLRQFWRDHLNKKLDDNPFTGKGVSIVYDEQFNRLFFTMIDVPNNKFITASYSPQQEAWASFHDHDSNYLYAMRGNRTFSIKTPTPGGPSDIYLHNVGPYGRYFNQDVSIVPFPMLAEVLYNDGQYAMKNFAAVEWMSQVIDQAGIEQPWDTFDFLTARGTKRGTGKIAVTKYTELVDAHVANTRLTEKTWGFNQIRNLVDQFPGAPMVLSFDENFALNPAVINPDKDWYMQGKFIDSYMAMRYEYLNSKNYKFMLLDHSSQFRHSIR